MLRQLGQVVHKVLCCRLYIHSKEEKTISLPPWRSMSSFSFGSVQPAGCAWFWALKRCKSNSHRSHKGGWARLGAKGSQQSCQGPWMKMEQPEARPSAATRVLLHRAAYHLTNLSFPLLSLRWWEKLYPGNYLVREKRLWTVIFKEQLQQSAAITVYLPGQSFVLP